MEICKTDILTVVRYLNDAAELYKLKGSSRHSDRARLMRNLAKKLLKKLGSNYAQT